MRNYFKEWFGGNKEVLKPERTAEQKKADDILDLAKMMGNWHEQYRMHMGSHVSDKALSDSTEDKIAKFIIKDNLSKQDIKDAWSLSRPPLPESEFNMFEHMIFQAGKRIESKEVRLTDIPRAETAKSMQEELGAIRKIIGSVKETGGAEEEDLVGAAKK